MLQVKAGSVAGAMWKALCGKAGLSHKELKKAAAVKTDKDFFLGLGWLLREDKVLVSEVEGEFYISLK